MTYETILYEVADRIATITFNRPDQLNAVSPVMERELRRRVRRAPRPTTRCGPSSSPATGRAFCAGADVDEIPDDGRVIYDEPLPLALPRVGGAAGGDAAVPAR